MSKATIRAKSIKVAVVLQPEDVPRVVSLEGPVGDVELELVLEGGAFRMSGRLNGKSYRKMLKAIDANNSNVAVVLQAQARPGPKGDGLVLESAGFQVCVRPPSAADKEGIATPSA